MSLTCATYGRQVFGIGGRLAWANGFEAGCYDMPAFIYDAGNGTAGSIFDVSNLSAAEVTERHRKGRQTNRVFASARCRHMCFPLLRAAISMSPRTPHYELIRR